MTRAARKARKRTTLRAALKIDILVESGLWNAHKDIRPVLRRAVAAAAAVAAPGRSTAGAELAIVLTDDSAIRLLNRSWRGIDAATDVLSFPTERAGAEQPLLGDILLAHETVAREARVERKPFAHHVAHLAVHGFLHLLGYDHETNEDAATMEEAERDALRRLEIPDPYRVPPRRGVRRRQR